MPYTPISCSVVVLGCNQCCGISNLVKHAGFWQNLMKTVSHKSLCHSGSRRMSTNQHLIVIHNSGENISWAACHDGRSAPCGTWLPITIDYFWQCIGIRYLYFTNFRFLILIGTVLAAIATSETLEILGDDEEVSYFSNDVLAQLLLSVLYLEWCVCACACVYGDYNYKGLIHSDSNVRFSSWSWRFIIFDNDYLACGMYSQSVNSMAEESRPTMFKHLKPLPHCEASISLVYSEVGLQDIGPIAQWLVLWCSHGLCYLVSSAPSAFYQIQSVFTIGHNVFCYIDVVLNWYIWL